MRITISYSCDPLSMFIDSTTPLQGNDRSCTSTDDDWLNIEETIEVPSELGTIGRNETARHVLARITDHVHGLLDNTYGAWDSLVITILAEEPRN
jgi:hypothetical protein